MAEDDTSKDDLANTAGNSPGDKTAMGAADSSAEMAESPALRGVTAPPRAKTTIEAEAIRSSDPDKERQAFAAADHRAASETAGEPVEGEPVQSDPAENEPAVSAMPQPVRRTSLWPLAAGIVLGAAIAVGGAYELHHLDHTPQALAGLEQRVGSLEQTNASLPALKSDAAALAQRLDALEAGAKSTDAALAHAQDDLRGLHQAAKQMSQKPAAAPASAAATDLAPLTARVAALEKQLTALDQKVSGFGTKLTSEMQVAQAQKTATAAAVMSRADAVSRALLASTLRRKVEAGEAFGDDLQALRDRSADTAALAPLEAAAATGVATPATLGKQFADVEPQILATAPQPKPQGFLGRLAQDAAHLVRIRKIGDTSGHDLAAQTARIAAALAAGRLVDAQREWTGLPEAAKAKSQAFGVALQQRIAAVAAAKALEAQALAAIAKAKS